MTYKCTISSIDIQSKAIKVFLHEYEVVSSYLPLLDHLKIEDFHVNDVIVASFFNPWSEGVILGKIGG